MWWLDTDGGESVLAHLPPPGTLRRFLICPGAQPSPARPILSFFCGSVLDAGPREEEVCLGPRLSLSPASCCPARSPPLVLWAFLPTHHSSPATTALLVDAPAQAPGRVGPRTLCTSWGTGLLVASSLKDGEGLGLREGIGRGWGQN